MNRGVILKAKELTKIITNLEVKPGGSLRFYGKWFGRPYDNYYKILECSLNDGTLIFKFDTGEQLNIWNPNKIEFNDKSVIINEASCVEFIRYSYGDPQTEKNLIIDRYSNEETLNTSIKNGKVYNSFIDRNYPTVELLSY